jgi:hypothetical protein
MSELVSFLTGDRSAFTLDGLEHRLRVWLIHAGEGISPAHALGFASAHQARLAVRNALLSRAARLLGVSQPWPRSVALAARVRTLETRWSDWQGLHAPPPGTPEVDCLLFEARQLGELPQTARGLFNCLD